MFLIKLSDWCPLVPRGWIRDGVSRAVPGAILYPLTLLYKVMNVFEMISHISSIFIKLISVIII